MLPIKMNLKTINSDVRKAVFVARRKLPELVCDAINLEGIDFTVPEVQTLLEGISIGGKKSHDEMIALNQAKAWKFLFDIVERGGFELSKRFASQIHHIAAKEEALTWGEFRTAKVTITGADYEPPFAERLDELWDKIIPSLDDIKKFDIEDIYKKAISVSLQMSRSQFFFDVNKRTSRFMMNGILLSQGLPAINVTADKKVLFNNTMVEFYETNDETNMQKFMHDCIHKIDIEIMSEEPMQNLTKER